MRCMNKLQKQVSNWAAYLALPWVFGMVYIMVEYRLFWLPAVMALIPMIPLGIAYRRNRQWLATARTTEGTVGDQTPIYSTDKYGRTRFVGNEYTVHYHYFGTPYTHLYAHYTERDGPLPNVGESITLLIDPNQPEQARSKTERWIDSQAGWFVCALLSLSVAAIVYWSLFSVGVLP
jgi:hypothetical protein